MTDRRFASITDIIAFAIQREIEAAETYAKIAGLAETAALRELAEDLRLQEVGHRRLLEGLSGASLAQLGGSYAPDLHIVDDLADETPAADMSIQEMLIFAAKKEAQAVALYESLARLAEGTDHRKLFLFLVGQEREHKLRLEAEYERRILPEN
jgi:rubrerythrin